MTQHYKFSESTEQFKTKALYTIRKAILNLSLQQTEDFTCFYASILLNMKVVITDQIWIAGISNDTLYMNPRFVLGASKEDLFNAKKQLEEAFNDNELDKKQYRLEKRALECVYETKTDKDLAFALFHEANHLVEETYLRSQALNLKSKADLDLWNIASDFVINGGIAKTMYKLIGECKKQVPIARFGCMDDKYNGMTTEQVYLELKKKQKEQQQQQKSSGSGSDSDEEVYLQFDEHMFDEMTEEEKQLLKDVIESAGRQAGKFGCPAFVWESISEPEEVKLDWRTLLPSLLSSSIISDITYDKIDPTSLYLTELCQKSDLINQYQNVVLPTNKTEGKIKIHLGFDTSGSIESKIKHEMLSEVVGMLSYFANWELTVFCWDTNVIKESITHYTQETADDVYKYKMLGGGGTDVKGVLEYFTNIDKGSADNYFIVFTDMYLVDYSEEYENLNDKLIWVVFGDNKTKAKIGLTCKY